MPREETTNMRDETTDDVQSSPSDSCSQTQLQHTSYSDYPLAPADDEPQK